MIELSQNPQDQVVVPRLKQTDVPKGTIKPRHLEIGLSAIKFGESTDRPTDGTVYASYFSIDTNVLSLWNGTAWKSVTLS